MALGNINGSSKWDRIKSRPISLSFLFLFVSILSSVEVKLTISCCFFVIISHSLLLGWIGEYSEGSSGRGVPIFKIFFILKISLSLVEDYSRTWCGQLSTSDSLTLFCNFVSIESYLLLLSL